MVVYRASEDKVYPRPRGGANLCSEMAAFVGSRSIPAHAGEPLGLVRSDYEAPCSGSIPAHAGEPLVVTRCNV